MSFPLLYDAHYRHHLEDLPLWLRLAAQQGGTILELGCGTGRVLLPIAQAGHRIIGIDKDPLMLSALYGKLTGKLQEKAAILRSDLTAFHLGIDFALILLPCNTFSTLNAGQRASALARVRQHLCSEGLFAVSLPNPALLARLPRWSAPEIEETFPHPIDGEPVQVSSGWKRSGRHFTVQWNYDHLLPDGQVERISVSATHYLEIEQTYQKELSAAGLHIIARYGDYDGSTYTKDSDQLILLATRSA
jgi:SAM-dependent methyltransferase